MLESAQQTAPRRRKARRGVFGLHDRRESLALERGESGIDGDEAIAAAFAKNGAGGLAADFNDKSFGHEFWNPIGRREMRRFQDSA